jgi:hypothetical protein
MVGGDIWQQGPPLSATNQTIEFGIACHGNENRPPHAEIGVLRYRSLCNSISGYETKTGICLQN